MRFWSDFNHVFYHPKSVVQLHDYEVNSSLMPFEKWQTGEELFENLDREHDLLDRDLRPFLEECDQLQAIQVLSGVDDAWGGFASKYLERIADDLGKGCRWLWGLEDDKNAPRERRALQAANTAQSIYATRETVSMYVPLTTTPAALPSYISMDSSSKWHTSALQAVLMESASLPSRLRSSESAHATLDHLELALSQTGHRRIAAAAFSAQDPADQTTVSTTSTQPNRQATDTRITNRLHATGLDDSDSDDKSNDSDISLLTSVSTHTAHSKKSHTFTTALTHRGAWPIPENASPHTLTHHTPLLFPGTNLSSYPPIFSFPSWRGGKLAIKTSLSTNTAVADRLAILRGIAGRALGLGFEEREALAEGLRVVEGEYVEGWDEGFSDSGEEDE